MFPAMEPCPVRWYNHYPGVRKVPSFHGSPMKKLQVYAVKEFVPPFILSIGVFTFVMLLDKLLDLLEMIVSKGVPMRTVGEIFLLLLPSMVAVVIPMGVLAGVLIAVGRLSSDLEVTAMKASGVSIFSLTVPLMAVAVLLAAVLVYFNNNVLPDANHMARNLLLDVGTMRPTARIIPGMFVDDIENYRILVGEKDDLTGELHDVVIHENIPGRPRRTITALYGTMEPVSANRLRLVLHDGQMQELSGDSAFRTLDYEMYTVEVTRSAELVRRDRDTRGDREMSSRQMRAMVDSMQTAITALRDSIDTLALEPLALLDGGSIGIGGSSVFPPADTLTDRSRFSQARNFITQRSVEMRIIDDLAASTVRNVNRFSVEIHKKYSIPVACIVFILIGVPLALSTRNSSAGLALGMSLILILVYYLFLIGGEQLADRGLLSPFLSMWAPNLLLGGLGIFLTVRSLYEGHPVPLPDFRALFERFQERRLEKRVERSRKGR
jgi:lipopolysaccharide export system permease protein